MAYRKLTTAQVEALKAAAFKVEPGIVIIHPTTNEILGVVDGLGNLTELGGGGGPAGPVAFTDLTDVGAAAYYSATHIKIDSGYTLADSAINFSDDDFVQALSFVNNDQVLTLNVSGCSSLGYLNMTNSAAMTSLNASLCAALAQVNIAGCLAVVNVNFSGCALPEVEVDTVLTQLVAQMNPNGTVNLSGGTNAPPSAAGLADKSTLEGVGWTVTVNS